MLVVVLVLSVITGSRAEYRVQCSDDRESKVALTPVPGVNGRYEAEYCTQLDVERPSYYTWELDLTYYEDANSCVKHSRRHEMHSVVNEIINNKDIGNCTSVCLYTYLDMIFESCYKMRNDLRGGKSSKHNDSYYNIKSNHTKASFTDSTVKVNVSPQENEDNLITFYTGLPTPHFSFEICINKTQCTEQSANCSPAAVSVQCRAHAGRGCHAATLTVTAPWTAAQIFAARRYITYDFCRTEGWPAVAGESHAWLWAAAVLGALGVVGVLAAVATRSARAAALRKRAMHYWRTRYRSQSECGPEPRGGRAVLLLYARDCEAGQRAARLLTTILHHATDSHVYDLFSAECVAESARAPAEWVRALVAHHEVRVVLLQTPAMLALYHSHDNQHTHQLSAPLLGSRAMYRVPHPGDALAGLALRLAADLPAHHHYHKYYLATLSELPTEMFPHLVPFRRYQLPEATTALVQGLTGTDVEVPEHLMQQYSHAVEEFVLYAKHNPNYLLEEVVQRC